MIKIFRLISKKFSSLGPGFITGAADDDPSGIATYSIAGAQFGYKLTWLTVFLTPLMYAVQEMCGRIGMVSGMGLAGCIKKYYPKRLLLFSITLLAIANIVNIGANLGVMAASLQMITNFPFFILLIFITIFTVALEIFIPYDKYSRYLKWMSLTLLVYGVTAIIVKQDWISIIKYTFIPHIEFDLRYLMTLVGFLGTTISPYLFFWQASEQVEEEITQGKISEFEESPAIAVEEINLMQKDTLTGMFFSNLVSFFIILTAAATLHANGITEIETPQQAALALRPLAGNFAFLLFTFGIIGIGLQSVPILAGGLAYSFAEAFGFKEGLSKKLTEAKAFYATIALATFTGALMNIVGINAIKALYYTAILNGIVAIPLIFIIIQLADNEKIVKGFKSRKSSNILAWIALIFMSIASIFMIFNLIKG